MEHGASVIYSDYSLQYLHLHGSIKPLERFWKSCISIKQFGNTAFPIPFQRFNVIGNANIVCSDISYPVYKNIFL